MDKSQQTLQPIGFSYFGAMVRGDTLYETWTHDTANFCLMIEDEGTFHLFDERPKSTTLIASFDSLQSFIAYFQAEFS